VCVFDDTYYKITTTNYISKTSLYTTFCMYSLGPWPLKILMFALLVTCEVAADIDIKILGLPPHGAGHAWMDDETNGWMDESHDEKASLKTTTTSFTICNMYTFESVLITGSHSCENWRSVLHAAILTINRVNQFSL